MIFISFIYLFIYPARFVALSPWAGGYFHLMNALYFSFVREVAKLFSSKLSHWRWWFSWGEQTQTTLWLFIILAGSRGSKPKANDTTRRKNVLCHIYASWILMGIFSLFRNALAFKDAETRRTLPKRELMALGTLWPAPCHAKPRNESKRIHFPQQFSAPQSLPLIRQKTECSFRGKWAWLCFSRVCFQTCTRITHQLRAGAAATVHVKTLLPWDYRDTVNFKDAHGPTNWLLAITQISLSLSAAMCWVVPVLLLWLTGSAASKLRVFWHKNCQLVS